MRIGFDAKRFFHNNTGLGYSNRTHILNLITTYKNLYAILFDSNPRRNDLTNFAFDNPQIQIQRTGRPAWYFRSVNANSYITNSTVQLYHGLSNELPLLRLKNNLPAVVTLNDILYQEFHEDFPLFDRMVYAFKTQSAIQRAQKIIAISEATKQKLIQSFPSCAEKIEVIYPASDPIYDLLPTSNEIAEVIASYKLPKEFIIYIGSITYRKNLKIIIDALTLMHQSEQMPLVVIGKGSAYETMIKKYVREKKLESVVHFLPNVNRNQAKSLVSAAQASVYPSLGEGFGLPITEALALNTPVITSNISSMPEAGGDISCYFDPKNAEELAQKIKEINKPTWQKENIQKRRIHLQKFSPSEIASKYFDLYQSVL